ncbi:alpha/beta fold hydrolase [Methylobacterium brachythecii]|uniref:Lipase n=1 Tax=Methylobacterium brachythecii TaxID=1176177 RepID=A0A7W6AF30_9HYPH|nr:alpha/beta fold hydrolase [Methylobacterium brachythecii]MBB3901543.1 acetyl esterase/lipase [Methylobacterium brachythecii]GLS43113.1 lipase [Methylobacterium brachythecii]
MSRDFPRRRDGRSVLALRSRVSRILGSILVLAALAGAPVPVEAKGGRSSPGTLLDSQPLGNAPSGAAAYRVLYRSIGLQGEPIAVSGAIIVPAGPAPAGGRPVVAWAHPTTGVVDKCAPSLARVLYRSIQGLSDLLERGYIVAATDYPGLGTPGVHPYLVGISEGRAVLDSVRAARQLVGSGGASNAFAVWGHSQGGHAALFTGLLARPYAPDLSLVGVAAAAPATELATLMMADLDTSGGKNLTAMTLWSWSQVYGAPMTKVVTPDAVPVINQLANDCIETIFDVLEHRGPSKALDRSFLTVDNLAQREPWRSLLARNTPGTLPPRIPIFLAQGSDDTLVLPRVTLDYRTKLCRAGSRVEFDLVPGVGHLSIAKDAAPAAIDWIADRFAGQAAPSNCGAD